MGLGVQPAVSVDKSMAVPLDFVKEQPAALSRRSEVVYTPIKVAGRGAGEERYPLGCSPCFEAFGAELRPRCGFGRSMGFVPVGAELGIAPRRGRAALACLWSLGRVEVSRGKGLGCEGAPGPVSQLQVVAMQVGRVWDRLVLDVNFWNLIPSALKL